MQILDLLVDKRDKLGSANSRRYCRAGKVPSILYGAGKESTPLVIAREAFDTVLKGHTALVRLTLGGVEQTALVREVTWNTFGEYVQHVDLQRVEMTDEIELEVPVVFVGVPEGSHHGGVLHVVHPELRVHSRVDSIPSELRYDVSHLELGDRVEAGDLDYPEHVRPAVPEDELVAHVREPHVHVEIEEELPPEEGEVVEGEEGAAPGEQAEKSGTSGKSGQSEKSKKSKKSGE